MKRHSKRFRAWIKTLLFAALFVTSATAQSAPATQLRAERPPVQDLADEPHHRLIFENDVVRVFQLKLQPHEAAAPHSHKHFYMYLSLTPITLLNEVRGRQPVQTTLDAAEVHTSKGGFNLAERNESAEPIELVVIEMLKSGDHGFSTPMGGFRYHDAAFGNLFETPGVRAYEMVIAAGGRTEPHSENYDRLIFAVSNLKLRDIANGENPSELDLKSGDVEWFSPSPSLHATTNVGTVPARFFTFEFSAVEAGKQTGAPDNK